MFYIYQVNVLADMEMWGVGVDMDACLNARHILIKKLRQLEKEAYELAGMPFSLHAAADIANVLYKHLKLPVPKGSDKGKLHPSTNRQSLDLLRYGILIGQVFVCILADIVLCGKTPLKTINSSTIPLSYVFYLGNNSSKPQLLFKEKEPSFYLWLSSIYFELL